MQTSRPGPDTDGANRGWIDCDDNNIAGGVPRKKFETKIGQEILQCARDPGQRQCGQSKDHEKMRPNPVHSPSHLVPRLSRSRNATSSLFDLYLDLAEADRDPVPVSVTESESVSVAIAKTERQAVPVSVAYTERQAISVAVPITDAEGQTVSIAVAYAQCNAVAVRAGIR